MRLSGLALSTLLWLVACGGSTFSADGAQGGGGSGGVSTSGSGGDAVAASGGRAGAPAGGESSAGAASAGESGAATGGAAHGGAATGGAAHGGAAHGGAAHGGAAHGGAAQGGAAQGGAAQGGAAQGGAAQGGASMAGAGGGMLSASCPMSAPVLGQPCAAGLSCSYGDDLRWACRARFVCQNNQWVSGGSATPVNCAPLVDCAATPGGFPLVNQQCPTVGEECSFDGMASGIIYCRCNFCGSSTSCPMSMASWACAGAPIAPCPAQAPNEGQPCDKKQSCTYGVPCEGATLKCDGKTWSVEATACVN